MEQLQRFVLGCGLLVVAVAAAWLWKLNGALAATPDEVLASSPHRWTEGEMGEACGRVRARPLDWGPQLPPRLGRRYIVTGGSGGVGGRITLQLLQRGQAAASIRNVDWRAPEARPELRTGPAAGVEHVRADISDAASTLAAFARPWPADVARLPLTVFHCAGLIVYSERSVATYDAVKRVNVDGTRNVIDAAKAVGADVLVATSSSTVALRPVEYWGVPWRRWPRNYWQVLDGSDFEAPLRPHRDFFSNYGHSKAVAERLVCAANGPGLRTGVIRPANGIYGNGQGDLVIGQLLRARLFHSWMPNVVQNLVHEANVALAHLLFEKALEASSPSPPPCAGRPLLITDPGPPPMFRDLYRAAELLAVTPVKVVYLPPVLLLLVAHAVELADAAARSLPPLTWLRPRGQLALLKPATFSACTHMVATDAAARRPVHQGGLGYAGVGSTLDGLCQLIVDWNDEQDPKPARPVASAATLRR